MTTFTSLPLAVRLGAPLAAAALLATACSSSGGSGSTGAAGAGAAAQSTARVAAGSGSGSGSAAEVDVHSGPQGMFLTDGSGRSLYLYTPDKGTTSTCTGGCASAWPPLTTQGKPTVGSGATASDLGTTKRSDGQTQVTYHGHPLYLFSGDTAAGQTNGEGSEGTWFLVSPAGAEVKLGSTSHSSSADHSSSSSGGGDTWG